MVIHQVFKKENKLNHIAIFLTRSDLIPESIFGNFEKAFIEHDIVIKR